MCVNTFSKNSPTLSFFLNFFCVAILRGMWDLRSPTRDWTCAPCSGSANFNYCQGSPNTELLMKTLKQTWVIPRTCLYIQNLIYKPGEAHVGWYSFWGMTFYNLICIRFLWSDSGKERKILQFEFGVYWEFHHLPEIQANQLSLSQTDLRARFMAWLASGTILRATTNDCTML